MTISKTTTNRAELAISMTKEYTPLISIGTVILCPLQHYKYFALLDLLPLLPPSYVGLASRAVSQAGQNKVLQRTQNYCPA